MQVLSLTAAFENDCAWCVAFHTAMALKEGVDREALVLDYPGVPARWRTLDLGVSVVPVVPVSSVIGTPQDITGQELRIESFFPLDDGTAAAARRLLG